jgi:hypothetical protein
MATAPKSEVLHMADLASYQDGSVVSRQITKEDTGNITLFAFDEANTPLLMMLLFMYWMVKRKSASLASRSP